MDADRLRRLAARLDAATGPDPAADRALLAALGWRPAEPTEGVCLLLWGDDPTGAPVWTGMEPRPTAVAADAAALHAARFGTSPDTATADPIAICRVIVRRLVSAAGA
ncbi:MAG: hypothetical protein AB7P02_04745 [Alphaproteobacteria bacterium]